MSLRFKKGKIDNKLMRSLVTSPFSLTKHFAKALDVDQINGGHSWFDLFTLNNFRFHTRFIVIFELHGIFLFTR